ncbi:MAG: hypothetical protein LLF92_00570 [Planctomycetaceae bacterium]|nr:hypothetical protein [Planctomycetaceae bacterium]
MENKVINSRRAFTIWELLFLLFIIFLLFSLLMPSLSKSRSRAVVIVCQHCLHSYSTAGQAFLNDNDDYFPEPNEWLYSGLSVNESHPIGCRWHDGQMSLQSETMEGKQEYYGKMVKYFDEKYTRGCPVFINIARFRGCENPNHNENIPVEPQYSYTMNAYLGGKQNGSVQKSNEVRNPAKVFFFAEENSWTLSPNNPKYKAEWLKKPLSTKALDDTMLYISSTSEARDCFATYHDARDLNSGSSNVVFIDGHVNSVSAHEQSPKTRFSSSTFGTAGNLSLAWASKNLPPDGLGE